MRKVERKLRNNSLGAETVVFTDLQSWVKVQADGKLIASSMGEDSCGGAGREESHELDK